MKIRLVCTQAMSFIVGHGCQVWSVDPADCSTKKEVRHQASFEMAEQESGHGSISVRVADEHELAKWVPGMEYEIEVGGATSSVLAEAVESMADDFADKFNELSLGLEKWSQATFGLDTVRGPMGALKHLEKEARECQAAVGTDDLLEEMADCLILLVDAARRAGVKPMQMVEAALKKMEVNKKREWPVPTDDEPVEHIR